MPSSPIAGAHYRPPAKALLDTIAVGTPLTLRREPDNAYDANAIMVILASQDINEAALNALADGRLVGYGLSIDDITNTEAFHVGYIPRELAAKFVAEGFPCDSDVSAEFSVSAGGAPRVAWQE